MARLPKKIQIGTVFFVRENAQQQWFCELQDRFGDSTIPTKFMLERSKAKLWRVRAFPVGNWLVGPDRCYFYVSPWQDTPETAAEAYAAGVYALHKKQLTNGLYTLGAFQYHYF